MKILVINSGSSSLKFQVVDPENEKALAKGVCERIGIDGIFNYRTDGGISLKEPVAMPDHKAAVGVLLSMLVDPERGVLKDFRRSTWWDTGWSTGARNLPVPWLSPRR